jgi:membrane protein DedA with SNARE-associated domain
MSAALASLGPLGVLLLMVPESACVTDPERGHALLSAGYGVHQAWFSFPIAVAAATGGNLIGSTIAYWLGREGALERLPRNVGVRRPPLRAAAGPPRREPPSSWPACFRSRARSVSLPAGHARIPFGRFVALTSAGCGIWSAAFILAGDLAAAGSGQLASDHRAWIDGRDRSRHRGARAAGTAAAPG